MKTKNVYVDKMINDTSHTLVGCYNATATDTNDKNDKNKNNNRKQLMTPVAYMPFDDCVNYAATHGFSLFGLQHVDESTGKSLCLVSNDAQTALSQGDASSKESQVVVWSSNTGGLGATLCALSEDGRLTLKDASGNQVWENMPPNTALQSACKWGGRVNPDTIEGSYGANCVGKPVGVDCVSNSNSQSQSQTTSTSYVATNLVNNLTSLLKSSAESNVSLSSWSVTPSLTSSFASMKDPAPCCTKLIDYSYQCGSGDSAVFKRGSALSAGSTLTFDCSAESEQCRFSVEVMTDGRLVLSRGSSPSADVLWSTAAPTAAQKSTFPNPEWNKNKCKFARDFLTTGDALNLQEWVGSEDGSYKLMLQSDGNLVLLSSQRSNKCTTVGSTVYGTDWTNAIYRMTQVGNANDVGKFGLIDSNNVFSPFLGSLVGFTTDYQIYEHTDILDDEHNEDNNNNNLNVVVSATLDDCKAACNQNDKCGAFVYQNESQTCWLKNNNPIKPSQLTYNPNVTMGQRKPTLLHNTNNSVIDFVDSVTFGSLLQQEKGEKEKEKEKEETEKEKQQKEQQKQQKQQEQEKKKKEIEQVNQLNSLFEQNQQNMQAIHKLQRKYMHFRKEGMDNMLRNENITLNQMMNDSELRVTQSNYAYFMWAVIAIGFIWVAMRLMSK